MDLLKDLPKTADNYDYIMDAKNALDKFQSIDTDLIPENSLISELLGIFSLLTPKK